MNNRQLFALENPCYNDDTQTTENVHKFEFRGPLASGNMQCAELRVINYFGMMTWYASAAVLDDKGEQTATRLVLNADRCEIKNILRGLIKDVGTGKFHEAADENQFMLIRELSEDDLLRLPEPPFRELLEIKERQNYALKRPVADMASMLIGKYKRVVSFGGTTYSTLLTIEDADDKTFWHVSVSILDDAKKPKKFFKVLKTEFEMAMAMMQAMLEGVGTGETSTLPPDKNGTAFHLFRNLNALEKAKMPKSSTAGSKSDLFNQRFNN